MSWAYCSDPVHSGLNVSVATQFAVRKFDFACYVIIRDIETLTQNLFLVRSLVTCV